MSHFTVMVIGDNPEEQLAPYHEFECTGVNDQYVVDIDDTADFQSEFDNGNHNCATMREFLTDYHGYRRDAILEPGEKPDTEGNDAGHAYGYFIMDGDKLIKAVRRTNPNAHWDWYQLGGRWQGFLKLKPDYVKALTLRNERMRDGLPERPDLAKLLQGIDVGSASLLMESHKYDASRADCAPKRAIDFDGMIGEHLDSVMGMYDKIQEIIAGRHWRTWVEVRDSEEFKGKIDEARTFFANQEVVKDVKEAKLDRFFFPWSDYKMPREQYEARERLAAISTYALVKDGEWYAKGEMGWFGVSSGDKDQMDWSTQLIEILDSVDDDTLISIYDCHI